MGLGSHRVDFTILVSGLLAVALGLATLGNRFALDDAILIGQLSQPGHDLLSTPHRVLTTLSYMLDFEFWGIWAPGYRITNLLLHGLATAMVALCAGRVASSRRLGFLAGLIFAVHPVHVEVVASFANRKDTLALIFALVAVALWIRPDRSWRHEVLAGVAMILGLAAKEVAVVGLPAILFLWDWRLSPTSRAQESGQLRHAIRASLPILIIGVAVAAWALRGVPGLFSEERLQTLFEIRMPGYPAVLANCLGAYPDVIRLLAWPARMSVDYPVRSDASLIDGRAILGVILICALAVGTLTASRRQRPVVAFALAWTLIMYLPAANIVPLTHFFLCERYLYVPSVGVAILAAYAGLSAATAVQSYRALGLVVASIVLVLTLGAGRSIARMQDWRDDETLWQSAARAGYDTWRIQHNLGVAHQRRGQFAQAVDRYQSALRFDLAERSSFFAMVGKDLVRALQADGRVTEAAEACGWLLVHEPDEYVCFLIQGDAAWQNGRLEEALGHYERLIELRPDHLGGMTKLAWLLAIARDEDLRDPTRALDLARRALSECERDCAIVLHVMAAARAESGEFDAALVWSRRARDLAKANGQVDLVRRIDRSIQAFEQGVPLSAPE